MYILKSSDIINFNIQINYNELNECINNLKVKSEDTSNIIYDYLFSTLKNIFNLGFDDNLLNELALYKKKFSEHRINQMKLEYDRLKERNSEYAKEIEKILTIIDNQAIISKDLENIIDCFTIIESKVIGINVNNEIKNISNSKYNLKEKFDKFKRIYNQAIKNYNNVECLGICDEFTKKAKIRELKCK